ncbi:hypothetical protein DPMN_130213 [Dreissena polymorpha]|uniref:Uncharacterized protein n=1 Tax=Dreissena polymorpha TaxID=45954 RepID=A0A9D4JXE2_DREPO|nr:hypothetical protein DPMN_063147 [Dreissena polymorpha]KAH3828260.1 hypothetical protein DPMN_130213 [Dreissena polymorpha]
MNLSMSQCRGQCYDGASNMTGAKRGVATNMLAKKGRAVFTQSGCRGLCTSVQALARHHGYGA